MNDLAFVGIATSVLVTFIVMDLGYSGRLPGFVDSRRHVKARRPAAARKGDDGNPNSVVSTVLQSLLARK